MSVDIQFNVDQALQKLGELVAKHGPQAVDLAAQVVRMNGVGNLVQATIFAAVATTGTVIAVKCGRKWMTASAAYNAWFRDPDTRLRTRPDDGFGWSAATIVIGIVSGITALIGISGLTDVWSWVALFDPKLALAHQVLAKFAGL